MILGHVRDFLPRVQILLPGQDGRPVSVEFIVDTAFDGDLSLPSTLLARLDAVYIRSRIIHLADGSQQSKPSKIGRNMCRGSKPMKLNLSHQWYEHEAKEEDMLEVTAGFRTLGEKGEAQTQSVASADISAMPNPITLSSCTFDLTISEEREDALCAQLVAYNKAHVVLHAEKEQYASAPLHIYSLDANGLVIGGVVGASHFVRSWLNISLVYVADEWRGHGLGRELMARAETEAMKRGCRYARLATGDYQAPGFYEKLGYVLYGTLEDCPPGETVYYYRKDLNSE